MRSKVEPMKEVAALVRRHLEGIVAWAQTRQTNGFLEALNGLFQAAKRRARGFARFSTTAIVHQQSRVQRSVITNSRGRFQRRVIGSNVSAPSP